MVKPILQKLETVFSLILPQFRFLLKNQLTMKYLIFLFGFVLLPLIQTFGQDNDQLSAGPMLGYTEHREVLIWLEVNQDVNDVAIRYWPEENFEHKKV
ncbi:MAG: hypothetical protein BRD49_02140, partial [Bacteroidetes bacterium SW_10_40_5]